jgi:hypothetical protein
LFPGCSQAFADVAQHSRHTGAGHGFISAPLEHALDLGDAVVKAQPSHILELVLFEHFADQHVVFDVWV